MKTTIPITLLFLVTGCAEKSTPASQKAETGTAIEPVLFVSDGLNSDGSLVKNYQRGLKYAIDYFGSYGPITSIFLDPTARKVSETSIASER